MQDRLLELLSSPTYRMIRSAAGCGEKELHAAIVNINMQARAEIFGMMELVVLLGPGVRQV